MTATKTNNLIFKILKLNTKSDYTFGSILVSVGGIPLAHTRLQAQDITEPHPPSPDPPAHLPFWRLCEDSEHGDLGHDRLAGPGGRTQQQVAVRVVERVEQLRLDRVEVGEAVEALVVDVLQRRDGQRPQVQQLCTTVTAGTDKW